MKKFFHYFQQCFPSLPPPFRHKVKNKLIESLIEPTILQEFLGNSRRFQSPFSPTCSSTFLCLCLARSTNNFNDRFLKAPSIEIIEYQASIFHCFLSFILFPHFISIFFFLIVKMKFKLSTHDIILEIIKFSNNCW